MSRLRSRRTPLDLVALSGREEIFRLFGAAIRDPAVDLWFIEGPVELRSMAQKWFMHMRRCGEDVRELMHDGCPVACVEDAPFGYVNAFKSHVNVGFFYGAALEDPTGLLQGAGKRMRHVKMTSRHQLDDTALGNLIRAAYVDIRARLGSDRSSRNA